MSERKKVHDKSGQFDGLVWILEGRVHVKNELKNGMPPTINPNNNCKLIINDKQCNHLAYVSENDQIEITPLNVENPFEIDIEISEDGLKAYCTYIPPHTVKRIVVDTYPVNKLDVECRGVILEKDPPPKSKIIDLIMQEGITEGIKEEAIDELLENNKQGKYLVAEGTVTS